MRCRAPLVAQLCSPLAASRTFTWHFSGMFGAQGDEEQCRRVVVTPVVRLMPGQLPAVYRRGGNIKPCQSAALKKAVARLNLWNGGVLCVMDESHVLESVQSLTGCTEMLPSTTPPCTSHKPQ